MNTETLIATITAQVTASVLAALGETTETPASVETPATAPAKDSYRVRTDAQKAASHKKIHAVNVRWNLKLAGGSRKVSDLSAAERKAYDAEIRACWTKPAGRKVTR